MIPLFLDGTEVNADVYDTAEFSDCPQTEWEQLDGATIQQDLGADMVLLDGPRYFIMDAAEANIDPNAPVETFGTLEMRLLATFTLDVSQANETPYVERTINRDTEFTFFSGAEVFELETTDGQVYVMQSYARIVDEDLILAELPSLGDRLQVPAGWEYRSRTLEADLVVRTSGEAHVVQDELKNTYLLEE